MTTVFSAYAATSSQAWADFDVYVPERWAKDPGRCDPDDLGKETKLELAAGQLDRLVAAGLRCGGQRWTKCMAAAASSAASARSSA